VDLALLDRTLDEAGEPAFRARQVWAWAARGAAGYDAMTDLPAGLRARLADEVPFSTLTLVDEAHARDGTVKSLFHTADGNRSTSSPGLRRSGRRLMQANARSILRLCRRARCWSSKSCSASISSTRWLPGDSR
jgi:23S rRNA (adenine2503-C2)-methyltransferase